MNTNLKLALLIAKESNQQYWINTFAFAIGRSVGNNVVISGDALVSRQHAVFLYLSGKLFLQDMGSRNGTMLNGKPIPRLQMMELHTGDEICIGMTKFLITDLNSQCQTKSDASTVPLNNVLKQLVASN